MLPKFCPIHLTIHVCDEQNLTNKNKLIDEELSSKVRRLHGTLTEEEIAKQNEKSKAKKGTLQWILENAKAKNQKVKNKLAVKEGLTNEKGDTIGVSNSEINSRVAALKKRISNNGDKVVKPKLQNIDISNIDKTKLTLQQVLYIAKLKNENSEKNKEYKPPTRSEIQPDYKKYSKKHERSIYQGSTINKLEREIASAKTKSNTRSTSKTNTTNKSRTNNVNNNALTNKIKISKK